MKDECVYELTSLDFDQSKLSEIMGQYEFKPWTPSFGYKGDTSKFQAYYEIRDPGLIADNPYIQDIVDSFHPDLKFSDLTVCFLKFPKGFVHKIHTDINRYAVVYFPLDYSNSPTIFEIENEMYKHHYTCPAIINVTKPHRSDVQLDRDRYAFTMSIKYHTFEDIKQMKNLYCPGLL